jgi:uncharacterized membrane protein YobD (UPF0266 family)
MLETIVTHGTVNTKLVIVIALLQFFVIAVNFRDSGLGFMRTGFFFLSHPYCISS